MNCARSICLSSTALAFLAALSLSGCQGAAATAASTGVASVEIRLDSASLRATNATASSFRAVTTMRVVNTGTATVYLLRNCQTGTVPSGTVTKLSGSVDRNWWSIEGVCDLISLPDGSLPSPIAIAPGASYGWTLHLQSLGGVPVADITGDYRVVLDIINADHKGSQVRSADALSLDMRTSATITIAAPA
jgi:hypothetical protein